jgi:FKBP-type peptidyl-prolyl cis-trans isomerase FkpA
MHSSLAILLGGSMALSQAPQAAAPPAAASALSSDTDRAIYAAGVALWRTLAPLKLTPAEIEEVIRGLRDATNGTPAVRPEDIVAKVAAFRLARLQDAAAKFRAASLDYLEKAGKEERAVTTASGLVFFDLQPGRGASPKSSDVVSVHFRGTLVNGVEFDSSYARAQPVRLLVSHLVPCWIEGLQLMKVGGKARLVCPAKLGYGDAGAPSRDKRKPAIPGGATLIFDVELFDIVAQPPRP